MADTLAIVNIIITGCSIVLIPVIIKALDITYELLKNVKKSKCCSCLEIERDEIIKSIKEEEEILKKYE
jgi:hypothetical protein